MPPRRRQHQEEAVPAPPDAVSLLDVVSLGPVQELIRSGLDSEDRQRLRETCRSLRDEVERSCTVLNHDDLEWKGQAMALVKLSRRMPQVQSLHLNTAEAVQVLSLNPPPSGEQHACVWMGNDRPSSSHNIIAMLLPSPPSLPFS
jgi:hypothetical protein